MSLFCHVPGKDDDVMRTVVSAASRWPPRVMSFCSHRRPPRWTCTASYAARGNAFAAAARALPGGRRGRATALTGGAGPVSVDRTAGRTSRTRSDPDRTAAGRVRRHLGRPVRKLTGDWLDRPMTSLHLILGIFALMLGFGLLMVLSSSSVAAFRNGGSSFSVFANQATYAALGLIGFCATQYLPVRLMRSLSTIAVIVSLALLVAVLIPGIGALVNGARSWIRIGGFQFQPSEIAKLALLLWMAHVLAARRSTLGLAQGVADPGAAGVRADGRADHDATGSRHHGRADHRVHGGAVLRRGAVVDVRQPRGRRRRRVDFYLAFSADYRLARLLSFINPEAHPDSSYQLLQSLYGMGNGGWFGVGLGQSRAKWSYLPNADSDFIFAIIGEELGLIGTGILLLLFALLAYTGLRIARRNVDPFVKIVASASTVWLVGQAAINIGYVVGLLPVTGIPLPMISAGGTSLLITMVVFGLLANFARREPQAAAALQAGGGNRLASFLGLKHADGIGTKTPSMRRRRRGTATAVAGAAAAGSATRRRTRPAPAENSRRGRPAPIAPAPPNQRWTSAKRSTADRDRAADQRSAAPQRRGAAPDPRVDRGRAASPTQARSGRPAAPQRTRRNDIPAGDPRRGDPGRRGGRPARRGGA